MILENLSTEVPPLVVLRMAFSSFAFYLSGSRYMGCSRPDSDWDYMAQDSEAIRDYLRDLGFHPIIGDYEGRKEVVLQYDGLDGKVQVSLTPNVQVKRNVRDIIKTYLADEHRNADVYQRNYLWGGLIDLLSFKAGDPTF